MFGDNQGKINLTDDEVRRQLIEAGVEDPDENDIELFRKENFVDDDGDGDKDDEDKTKVDPKTKTPAKKTTDEEDSDEEDSDDDGKDKDDDDDGDDHDADTPNRPQKYIPIPQYKDEKKQWKEEKQTLMDRISQLETKGADTTEGSKSEDELIDGFKKKYPEADTDQLKEIISLARQGMSIPDELKKDIEISAQYARNQKEKEFDDKEFAGILPQIKARFPNADDAQIDKIRKRLDVLSHTKELHKTPLNYIFSAHADEFDSKADEADDKQVGKKTVERTRGTGSKVQGRLTAKDFKGKTDFTALMEADEADQNRIIAEMPGDMWEAFVAWQGGEDGGLVVNRGGQKIKLK